MSLPPHWNVPHPCPVCCCPSCLPGPSALSLNVKFGYPSLLVHHRVFGLLVLVHPSHSVLVLLLPILIRMTAVRLPTPVDIVRTLPYSSVMRCNVSHALESCIVSHSPISYQYAVLSKPVFLYDDVFARHGIIGAYIAFRAGHGGAMRSSLLGPVLQ